MRVRQAPCLLPSEVFGLGPGCTCCSSTVSAQLAQQTSQLQADSYPAKCCWSPGPRQFCPHPGWLKPRECAGQAEALRTPVWGLGLRSRPGTKAACCSAVQRRVGPDSALTLSPGGVRQVGSNESNSSAVYRVQEAGSQTQKGSDYQKELSSWSGWALQAPCHKEPT